MSEELDADSHSVPRVFRVAWFAPQRPVATTVFVKPAPLPTDHSEPAADTG